MCESMNEKLGKAEDIKSMALDFIAEENLQEKFKSHFNGVPTVNSSDPKSDSEKPTDVNSQPTDPEPNQVSTGSDQDTS